LGYLRRFLVTLFVLLGAVAALDGLVDPYDLLGAPVIAGFNQVKSPAPDRFFKPLQASARRPRTVFIGNSRVLRGLDPADMPRLDAYNLGIPGATIAEEVALARHVMVDTRARLLVIGLDYLSFNDAIRVYPSFHLAILGRDALWRALPDILISQRALVRSRDTMLRSRRDAPARYRHDGLQLPPLGPGTPRDRVLNQVRDYTVLDHAMAGDALSLARFARFLASVPPGIEIVALVPPEHAALAEVRELGGLEPRYEAWLRQVTRLCARHGVALWDFSGYNSVTTLPLAATGPLYYDGSHFRPAVGRMVLARMFEGAGDPDFGIELTPADLPAFLAAQERARAAWQRASAGDWQAIAAAERATAQSEGWRAAAAASR
jgi:hypothetical protein